MHASQELLDALERVLTLAWYRVKTDEDHNAMALMIAYLMELEHGREVR